MEWIILLITGMVIYAACNKKCGRPTTVKNNRTDLVDFRITGSRGHSDLLKTKNKQPGKWVMPGEIVKVNDIEISGGFIYFGGQLKSLDNYDTESSLVDPTLKVNIKSPDYGGNQMGYRPSYHHISPESRAAYIKWLAGNRSDPETYIGYVFLYFYGIERRLLVDDQNGQVLEGERKALVQELQRLKSVYGGNRSFNGYVTSLLSHAWIINHQNKREPLKQDLMASKNNFTSIFKDILANTMKNRDLVTDELALAWIQIHPELSLRTPIRRCTQEFDTLFTIRFKQKFNDGLKIAPNKTKLQFDYHPASSSLRGYQSVKSDLPDVSRLQAPVTKLMALAGSCANELDAFSRYVGKPGNSRNSLGAQALLPGDLVASISNPQFEHLKAWIKTQISESNGLVSVESLLQHFGDDAPLKINKKEAEMLSNIVEKAGFGIAPDIRYHYARPDINGKAVLFSGGHDENFSPSHAFKQVGTILRLGAMVARIDGHVDEAEVRLLRNLVTQDNQLIESEKQSLIAYLHWCLHSHLNMNGLKARLETINKLEKTAISHILVGIAFADGKVDPTEIRQLEKLYTSLGLDRSMVTSDIHSLWSNKPARSTPEEKAGIDNAPDTKSNEMGAFSLDRDLLKVHEEETQDVQAILESIFVEENDLDEAENAAVAALPSGHTIPGLDRPYHNLYEKLICKEKWSFDEVKKLCEEQKLMVDGAIEVINDWAFDKVDAPLIEDGSTVFIDLELVEEIATLETREIL